MWFIVIIDEKKKLKDNWGGQANRRPFRLATYGLVLRFEAKAYDARC